MNKEQMLKMNEESRNAPYCGAEEDVQVHDEEELTLIDPEMYYDLLMEQQEQM